MLQSSIEVNKNDSLKIAGVAQANAKVLIFIGEDAYEVDVDENGEWVVEVDISNISEGEYLVEALTKVSETQGSEKTVLFPLCKITLLLNENSIDWPEPEKIEYSLWQKLTVGSLRFISMIVLGLLLIGLIILLLIIVAKNESTNKKEKKLSTNKNEAGFEREDPSKENIFKKNLMEEASNREEKSSGSDQY